MRRKLYALLAGVFYALGVAQAFSGLDIGLPFYQLENAILLGLGAAFLIAFFRANQWAGSGSPGGAPPPSESTPPSRRRRRRRRGR
jgi:hypothetical protein